MSDWRIGVLVEFKFVKSSLVSAIEENNANNIGSGMKNIMDEDVIPTQCSAKVVKGDDRECQAVYIPNPTTVPPVMKTSFTSLLQNLHNLGKTGDPGHVKESPSGAENIF
ncbi:hypothetical protein VNO77_06623 [Canavalia gladiata]|uniref:Uncharacterized protein n=1 Tax=Canavalia gladiata TaxID=3824 RepID=A0AAN9M6T7_CANGL